jgi:hypothetical protein
MHVIEFIHDLAIIMLAAGIVTVVFHLLRQPVVLGYIVAGVLIGPHTPPYTFVTNEETIRTLADSASSSCCSRSGWNSRCATCARSVPRLWCRRSPAS